MKEAGLTEAQLDIFPFPTGSNRLYGFGENYYVSTKSAVADEAAKFLDHMVSTEVHQANLGAFGSVSVNSALHQRPNLSPGDTVPVDLDGAAAHYFDAGTGHRL